MKDLPDTVRPRERLLAGGVGPLSDQELVALILGSGWGEETAMDLAARLLAGYGGLRGLRDAEVGDLTTVHGIGPAKAAVLKAALELGKRADVDRLEPGELLTGPQQVYRHCRAGIKMLGHRLKNIFHVGEV